MSKIQTMIRAIKKPGMIIRIMGDKKLLTWIPDALYLKIIYRAETGKRLDLKHPKTYNEKLQWLKLYDRRPEYTMMVDKYEVRKYVAEKIGEEYLIPLIGVYDSVDEIPWEELPDKFVLKCTHGSGSNILCNDKKELDIQMAKKKLRKWMKKNFFWVFREWPYKNVKPRIVCEKYMVDESGIELKDYKIFCFDGEPKLIQVDFDRFRDHKRNIYDLDWNLVDLTIKYPRDPNKTIARPDKLDEMLDVARKLSAGIPHVRVDLYSIGDKIYFGELTFTHGAGYEPFYPESYNELLGSWLKLPNRKTY